MDLWQRWNEVAHETGAPDILSSIQLSFRAAISTAFWCGHSEGTVQNTKNSQTEFCLFPLLPTPPYQLSQQYLLPKAWVSLLTTLQARHVFCDLLSLKLDALTHLLEIHWLAIQPGISIPAPKHSSKSPFGQAVLFPLLSVSFTFCVVAILTSFWFLKSTNQIWPIGYLHLF